MQRSRSPSSSEEVAGCPDTLTEILLRVPAKPLIRFKCVSKQWFALISDPQFCHFHTLRRHHTPSPSALLLADQYTQSPSFETVPLTTSDHSHSLPSTVRVVNLDFLKRPRVAVVRSCNGLLICHSPPSSQHDLGSTYFVCNPTTRKFVTLSFPNHQFRNQIRALYLGFDPLRSPYYDVISIRELVYREILGDFTFDCEINVYSSRTGSWSDTGICFPAASSMVTGDGVYCNRAIHWCGNGESSLYFDVDRQCLKILPMPLRSGVNGNRSVECFGESGGRLHLIRKQSLEFTILELQEDFSGWSLRHHLDLNHMRVQFPNLHWDSANFAKSFYIVCQANKENSMLVLLVGGTAISYNPVNCTSRKLCDFKPDMTLLDAVMRDMSVEVFQYFENLSCIGAFTAYY